MTKKDIIVSVSNTTGLLKIEVEAVFESILMEVSHALEKGERVDMRMFGNIVPVKRKEKKGNNITAGKQVIVPAKMFPKFIPSPYLLAKMNTRVLDN